MYKYYIAYGSNLNKRQMKMRCPTARIVGHGYLRDYTLVFRRFATIEKCIGEKVPVTVWYIDDESEKIWMFMRDIQDSIVKNIAMWK